MRMPQRKTIYVRLSWRDVGIDCVCDFLNLIFSNAALINAKQKMKININFYIYSQKGSTENDAHCGR